MENYLGIYNIEQDLGWEPEQCPVTKEWARTKRVSRKTWTVYKRTAKGYQTPVAFCSNEKTAREKMEEFHKNS